MEGKKLNVSALNNTVDENKKPSDTYKQIPENDMEGYDVENKQMDGALEKMLPKDDKVQNVEIKFINDKQNGEAKLNISDPKTEFVGMSKEELLKYANDPFWVKLRWILFVCFWLLWAGMLIGAVLIIVVAPKCVPPEPRTWWELGPLAEVSHDINEDALKVLKENRIEGVIVNWPRDTYDLHDIQNVVGKLLNQINLLGINAIVSLNPGTSSMWFERSEGKDDKYDNYYIWSDGKGHNASGNSIPPNNWVTQQNKSAWLYSDVRNQFYLIDDSIPRLNMRNPNVVLEFTNVLRKFIAAGFKGVRLEDGTSLLIDPQLQDETVSNVPGYVQPEYGFYTHARTTYQEESGQLLKKWREVVKNDTQHVFMLKDDLRKLDPFKVNGTLTIDLPKHTRLFINSLINVNGKQKNAEQIKVDVDAAYRVVEDNWPLWESKVSTTLPEDVIDHVTFLLKGVTLINSTRTIDKELLTIRKDNPAIMYGSLDTYSVHNGSVFAFTRVTSGKPGFLVAVNLLDEQLNVDLSKDVPVINEDVTVQLLSKNYNMTSVAVKHKIRANDVPISPLSSMILSYVPKKDD